LSGEAQTIVTGDADLLDDDELRRRLAEHGIRVVTPAELVEMLGK
jgi:predicted nucleic acid-binding protein